MSLGPNSRNGGGRLKKAGSNRRLLHRYVVQRDDCQRTRPYRNRGGWFCRVANSSADWRAF